MFSSVGRAWSVSPMRGKAKLFARFDDGSRKSVVLPIPWVPASTSDILNTTVAIAQLVATGKSFDDAKNLVLGGGLGSLKALPAESSPDVDLINCWKTFGENKVHRTGQIKATTWAKDYAPTTARIAELACAEAKTPSTAKQLLAEAGLPWPPGSRRRQMVIQQLAAMLRWAVAESLLEEAAWSPPQVLRLFIGEKRSATQGAIPFSDAQILSLLEALPHDSAGKRWRFAIQLCAAYGLRPIELRYLQDRGTAGLWCSYQKRSGGGTTKPRRLRALHPEWETEWSLREQLKATTTLPPLESPAGPADAMRKYLLRHKVWIELTSEERYTPYSFRHGYALRAHQMYGLSPRVTAALMGHSVSTHTQHYGQWTDDEAIDSALEAGLQYRNRIGV